MTTYEYIDPTDTCVVSVSALIMAFAIGDKVQAVDELGQWTDARVMEICDDGAYRVNYDGWTNKYDNVVREPYIRFRDLPMEQQTRSKPRQS
jgi:hypothetical protein